MNPGRAHSRSIILGLVAADYVAMAGALLLTTVVRFGNLTSDTSLQNTPGQVPFWAISVTLPVVWLVFMAFERLYDVRRVLAGTWEYLAIARALLLGAVALILVSWGLKVSDLSRAWLLFGLAAAILAVWTERAIFRTAVDAARRRGALMRRTLLVGSNAEGKHLLDLLRKDPASGLDPVGVLLTARSDELPLNFCDEIPCLGIARDMRRIVIQESIDAVVIASSAFDHDVLSRMIGELRDLPVEIEVSSGLFEILTSRVFIHETGGIPLMLVKNVSLSTPKLILKRTFDLVVASVVILLGMPVWLAVALAIKLTSPGPVFYRQTRVGRGGAEFNMFKFRTMYVDADKRLNDLAKSNEASGPIFKMREDPRVTPVGRFLRKFSIDEFPQLIDVIHGDMSLVGPRPPLPHEVALYSEYDLRRLEVVPGMTGLWQVSGRSDLTFGDMVRLDLFYIENWSLPLDILIILRTVPAVLAARGAY